MATTAAIPLDFFLANRPARSPRCTQRTPSRTPPRSGAQPPGDCDGDGVPDASDNCPQDANAGQTDTDGDGHLVGLASAGTAFTMRARGENFPTPERVEVRGDLVTGGGRIRGVLDPDTGDYLVHGIVDTSGTHPELARCQTAMDAMIAVSEQLAALPATRNPGCGSTGRARPLDRCGSMQSSGLGEPLRRR